MIKDIAKNIIEPIKPIIQDAECVNRSQTKIDGVKFYEIEVSTNKAWLFTIARCKDSARL